MELCWTEIPLNSAALCGLGEVFGQVMVKVPKISGWGYGNVGLRFNSTEETGLVLQYILMEK